MYLWSFALLEAVSSKTAASSGKAPATVCITYSTDIGVVLSGSGSGSRRGGATRGGQRPEEVSDRQPNVAHETNSDGGAGRVGGVFGDVEYLRAFVHGRAGVV